MGILSFAALLSYDVNQDSLNNTQPVQDNWVGTVGANFANWVLGVVGIGSGFCLYISSVLLGHSSLA